MSLIMVYKCKRNTTGIDEDDKYIHIPNVDGCCQEKNLFIMPVHFIFLWNIFICSLECTSDWIIERKWTSALKKKRKLEKATKRKEIQIGCKTFPPMLIKWKHKKRMHFEIETIMKILAHLILIELLPAQWIKRVLYFENTNVNTFSGLSLKNVVSWNWCLFRRFTLILIKTKRKTLLSERATVCMCIVILCFILCRLSWLAFFLHYYRLVKGVIGTACSSTYIDKKKKRRMNE